MVSAEHTTLTRLLSGLRAQPWVCCHGAGQLPTGRLIYHPSQHLGTISASRALEELEGGRIPATNRFDATCTTRRRNSINSSTPTTANSLGRLTVRQRVERTEIRERIRLEVVERIKTLGLSCLALNLGIATDAVSYNGSYLRKRG